MQWTVIIPVKPASSAKSRLGLRPELARAIALDTIAAAVASEAIGRVLVVTADLDLPLHGAELVAEREPAGIASAIRSAVARVAEASAAGAVEAGPVAALLGDLPALRPADLADALAIAANHPRAFVADREGTGTTLVTARAGVPLLTAFGASSAAAHRALGLQQLELPDDSTVTADVDTADQLAVARALGLGPATAAALAGSRSHPHPSTAAPGCMPRAF